jgi:decaprenyl-phosphate phosphoribosyltransferase
MNLHYLKLIRPLDWIKNLILFLPIFFSNDATDLDLLKEIIKLFFVFCVLSSTIYVFNDLCDISQDKLNKVIKKNKPLAEQKISKKNAIIFFIFLLIFSFVIIFFQNQLIQYCCIFFLLINFLYSLILKNIFFIEILTIVVSYLTRIYTSSLETEINLSFAMIALILITVIFIISLKRKNEIHNNKVPRKSLRNINISFFNNLSLISYFLVIIIYFYYSFIKNNSMMITFIFFFLILTRFYFQSEKTKIESPVIIFFKDKLLLLLSVIWSFLSFYILYFIKT